MAIHFNHVAIRVSDVPAAAERYASQFDAKVAYISPVGSEPGCAALCRLPDGSMIELFEEGQGFAGSGCGSLGLIHIAFSVDNVDDALRAALDAGGTLVRPSTDNVLDMYPDVQFRTAFYRDLEGTVHELMEHGWADDIFAAPRSPWPPDERCGITTSSS